MPHAGVNPLAALVMPAIRWDAERGFADALPAAEAALALGAGGFIIFGGERGAVRALTRDLAAAAPHPLLIASDLERGAGQQVAGLTALPPAGALGALGPAAAAEAAAITAREARDVGVSWALAPVLDLDAEPENPIVQTRAFGGDPDGVARAGAAWIEACQGEGVLACAKHFPGHGRTTRDSHTQLPVVAAPRATLEADRRPYGAAVRAGVAGVMTAHVAFPDLDPSGAPATFSRPIIEEWLRRDLDFDGLVVTDALIMEAARRASGADGAAVRAIQAGCDLLLYPEDAAAVTAGLERARASGAVPAGRLDASLARRHAALARAAVPRELEDAALARHRARAQALARDAVRLVRGEARPAAAALDLVVVDDDAGGAYPVPPRAVFAESLRAGGARMAAGGERVVAVFSEVRGGKGRTGLSPESRVSLAAAAAGAAAVVLFAPPRLAAEVPGSGPIWCAWSGDLPMQRAAAERLLAP
jgi:beta-glucosidase-like glycosyl hydrolase